MPPSAARHHDVPDLDLVTAARNGDRAALDTLLRRHHDRVRAVAYRLTGNHADAADATQQALLAVVRGLHRFDGRSSFSTWLYRVTTNACLDELRRRRRRPVPVEPTDPDERWLAPNGEAQVEARLAVDAALAQLAVEFRVPVILRDLAGLDYAQIAAVLDLPLGTVKSRIARGRSQLADLLGNPDLPPDRPIP